ncbi:RHS repeat domain-containing protein [Pseudidiomarina donghaiensis]|uniref:RHS repeat domain-containing protein n=1 Tax=Pseudidiomarina donghaiensis TaxID=519452 RepID=UPI001F53F5A5|nr:RHS repeat-associated core domain-containing protein [Pseudidiomarina donghaiensis]
MQRESASTTSEATYLLFKDHLGSVFTTLATTGEIISQQLFSAFGQTRTIYTAGGVALGSMLPPTEQGFTGHRQMDALGIVHMKGRIYDPTLGRFLQADLFVQAPKNNQNYNRYSYVLNNPMSYTDPSGYFFSKLWEKIKPIIGVIVVAALYAYCPACATYFASSWYGAATAGAIAGGVNAGFNGGNILTGALRGAFAAAAFYGVGQAFEPGSFGHIAGSGLAGGIMSEIFGGNFGHGFLSAGVNAMASGTINGIKQVGGRIIASAVVGGTVSKLTGGKFANGAIVAAFSRVVDETQSRGSKLSDGKAKGELTLQETEALDRDLIELNKKISSLKSFQLKEEALSWLHKNVHPLAVDHDVEIAVNIFDDLGQIRLGNAVTDYYRHEISSTTLLTSNIRGWEKGWAANWHSHADGPSGGFSYSDHKLYQSWSDVTPNVTYHMSRINFHGRNVLDTYEGQYYVKDY